jgi:hypothetical protein
VYSGIFCCHQTPTEAVRIRYLVPLFSPYDIYIDSSVDHVGFLYYVFICRRKLNCIDLDLKCGAEFYISS